jgi:N-formylglutamate deformylase
VRVFEEVGWSVAVDRPFAGALVPMRFYRKDLRVRAIMVEVRRDLYMDERGRARGCPRSTRSGSASRRP